MLVAESERESAKQRVLTVQVTSEAEREAEKKLIAAKQGIAEHKIREETAADVKAYMAIKQADAEGRVTGTVPRQGLWLAQTPQVFRRD